MRIGPFIFTTVKRLRQRVQELSILMKLDDAGIATLVLCTRLTTGETTIANLRQITAEIDLQLALQEEKDNGSDPQSGEIATKSESGI